MSCPLHKNNKLKNIPLMEIPFGASRRQARLSNRHQIGSLFTLSPMALTPYPVGYHLTLGSFTCLQAHAQITPRNNYCLFLCLKHQNSNSWRAWRNQSYLAPGTFSATQECLLRYLNFLTTVSFQWSTPHCLACLILFW